MNSVFYEISIYRVLSKLSILWSDDDLLPIKGIELSISLVFYEIRKQIANFKLKFQFLISPNGEYSGADLNPQIDSACPTFSS